MTQLLADGSDDLWLCDFLPGESVGDVELKRWAQNKGECLSKNEVMDRLEQLELEEVVVLTGSLYFVGAVRDRVVALSNTRLSAAL